MTDNMSLVSRRAKVLCAGMIALCALLAPVKSYAVSEESEDTINHIIFPATQGTVTQITDQKVIWVAGTQTVSLDRSYRTHVSYSFSWRGDIELPEKAETILTRATDHKHISIALQASLRAT
jgi:hypothetical protein